MPKYEILKAFCDIHTDRNYVVGEEIEMSVERAVEATTNLKKFGGGFFVEILPVEKAIDDLTKNEITEKLEQLQVSYNKNSKREVLLKTLKDELTKVVDA